MINEIDGFKKCITITNPKVCKIKKMMWLLRKFQLDVIHQLNHFVNEVCSYYNFMLSKEKLLQS